MNHYGEYTHLNREEQIKLWEQSIAGDEAARDKLLTNWCSYILKLLAKKYGNDKYDAMHEVMIMLIKKFDKFNPHKGGWPTWIHWVVRWYKTKSQRRDYRNSLTFSLSDIPTMIEGANDSKKGKDFTTIQPVRSFKCVDNYTARRAIIDDESLAMRRSAVGAALNVLHQKDQDTVRMHYLEGKTMMEIGEKQGRSFQAVNQSLKRALKKMRPAVEDYMHAL